MSDELNEEKQPKEYDLVLGGNNPPPTDGLVLGGIEGLKLQFNNANSEEKKIAILQKALAYGETGEAWLLDLIATENDKIQWLAAVLLSNTKNKIYKELLLEYFADFIPKNVDSWNEYKQTLPNFEINLSAINIGYNKELHQVDFSKVNLKKANLSNLLLYEINFFQTNLSQINLKNTTVVSSNIKQSNLENANLTKALFYGAELDEVNLSNAIFVDTDFCNNACIQNMLIDHSYSFSNTSFSDIIFKNVTFKNVNLQNIYFYGSSFENVVFDNCNLISADFRIDCIANLIFKDSNLENIRLMLSNLKGVKFDCVNLRGADFRWSDLTGVNFTGLDVRGANFTRCTFGNNNLDKANTKGAKFSSINSPRFPPNLKTSNLKGALFDDQHYYEPGYE
ncbi:pentapeptide repeat-containing protein [Crocosphaera chwakensis]|uniref:Pentapeptide repeat family protein n=1 Tax=Crocosphaera chwakensis CCY0110 TaxID=391612 RepID=A3ITC5_9CHRO|nr:pentapeptide repeat-containing protein [Crocosphaera chwakensis]EAZ90310.1 pentapeptide repeat family protein [Crocosphaera chwakensis CCY0110]